MNKRYDYLVVGSGPAGHVSAITAAKLGLKTAILEKDIEMLGGVCLNEGCIPAKSLYSAAYYFGAVKKYPGILGPGSGAGGTVIKEMTAKSRLASDTLKRGLSAHLKKLGVDVIEGSAEFETSSELKVIPRAGKSYTLAAGKILIATGSTPRPLTGTPFDGKRIISSTAAVKLDIVPEKVLIVGAGAIGVEFASFFSTMGSEVTLLETENEILPSEDRDISSAMRNVLKKMGVRIFTSSSVKEICVKGDKVFSGILVGEGEIEEGEYDIVLVSVGRVPRTKGIGLEKVGVKLGEKGFIPVDGEMRTNVDGIYAAGDVVSSPMLAHIAQAEGELAAFSAVGKPLRPIDYSSVPNAVYSAVQCSSVGVTEKQAERAGAKIVTGKSFFKANGKAVAAGEDDGFVKVIVDAGSRAVLGAHIVGHLATEMIHEFAIARRMGLTIDDIAWTVHAHPTFSESAALVAKEIFFKL